MSEGIESGDRPRKGGFFRRVFRFFKDLVIVCLIVFPCGYAFKMHQRLERSNATADSLRTALAASYSKLDSMKTIQDNEVLVRDSLEDLVDRRLEEGAGYAAIVIDTASNWLTARRAIDESISLQDWVDATCSPYSEAIAAHVKLHYLQAYPVRLERLNQQLQARFPNME